MRGHLGITTAAMRWAASNPERGRRTTDRALLLEQIAGTCGYGALIGGAAAVAFTIAAVGTADPTQMVATAVGMALSAHLMMTAGMIIKRLMAIASDSLAGA